MDILLKAKDNVSIPIEGYIIKVVKGWETEAKMVNGIISIKFNVDKDDEIYGIFRKSEVTKLFEIKDGD